MKLDTIVLSVSSHQKRNKNRGRGQFELVAAKRRRGAPKPAQAERPVISVGVEALSAEENADVQRDPKVIGTAPAMPLQLIKPMKSAAKASKKPSKISWGVEAVNAAKSKFDGDGVTVAVLDTGIDRSHPAFANVAFKKGDIKNFTNEVDADIDGHGTHCAGTIFGQDVDGCRIGIARGVKRRLIGKVLGEGGGSTKQIYEAIRWAQQKGAQIISMSLGMDFPGFQKQLVDEHKLKPEHATSLALSGYRENVRLFDRLSQLLSGSGDAVEGTILVAAAGNESLRPDFSIIVAPPAAGERFLSVGALQRGDTPKAPLKVAAFSNSQPYLAAPGVDIWSAKLGGGLVALDGTSMAAPHVAGVAALWAQKRLKVGNNFNASRVIQSIDRSCEDLSASLSEEDVGLGLVQAPVR